MKLFKVPNHLPHDLKFDIKSIHEELANMISHGIGWLLAIFASPFLLYQAYHSEKEYAFFSVSIYIFSLIMVYTSSTLYHSAYKLSLRRKLRIFDHISIYFLIAGSYTPFLLIYLRTDGGYLVLKILWTMVLIGGVFKLFFTHKFKLISTLAYVVMGWLIIIIIKPFLQVLPNNVIYWISAGGFFYLFGTIFYLWKSLKQNHFIWHLFVLAGSICHFIAVYFCLV